ncbi:MAG TPA: tetratricopeptide repeat protein [Micromonosporaceae bacterium]
MADGDATAVGVAVACEVAVARRLAVARAGRRGVRRLTGFPPPRDWGWRADRTAGQHDPVSVAEHLTSICRTATALRERGDLDAARSMLAPAIDLASASLGADHPDVLDATGLLADVEYERGDLRAARRLLEEALAAGQVPLGPAHPQMLALAARLGAIAHELGNRHEARRNFTTVSTLGRAVLAPDDPALLVADRWLAADAGRHYDPVPDEHPTAPPSGEPGGPDERVEPGDVPGDAVGAGVAGVSPAAGEPNDPPEWPAVPPDWSLIRPDRSPAAPAPDDMPTLPVAPGVVALPRTAPPASASAPRSAEGSTSAVDRSDGTDATTTSRPSTIDGPADAGCGANRDADGVDAAAIAQRAADTHDAHRRSRTPVIALAVVTGVAALAAAVVVLTAFFTAPARPPASAGPVPTATSAPPAAPTGLALRDHGGSVTLTWSDPTDGRVPFAIAAGRAGENSRAFQSVPPGTTRYTVNGLNPTVDYCFAVVAVYSTDQVATSELVCTDRPDPTATR